MLVDLLTHAENVHNQHWALYAVVAFGILGFCFSGAFQQLRGPGQILLTVGFLVFTATNIFSMCNNAGLFEAARLALADAAQDLLAGPVQSIAPIWLRLVIPLHLVLDGVILAAIWHDRLSSVQARPDTG